MTTTAIELYNPTSGELIPLDAPTDVLVEWFAAIRKLEQELATMKQAANTEVLRRMDAEAHWTVHTRAGTLTGKSPAPTVAWDPEQLAQTLTGLVADGLISQGAADSALELVQEWKPKRGGINKLLKLGGEIAERIAACGHDVEPNRRVQFSEKAA